MQGQDQGGSIITFDLMRMTRWVAFASLVVIGLGVFREVFVLTVGGGTVLQDLRPIGLDSEMAIPAFYSSMLMLACVAVLWLNSRVVAADGGPDYFRWVLLAVIFALMALDESASLHETLMTPVRNMLGLSGLFYYAWVVPGAIGVALIGLYYLPFLFRLPRRSAVLIIAAGALYVSGALGFELFGGALEEAGLKPSPAFSTVMSIEESLEIIGLSLFFYALVDHLGRVRARFPVSIVAASESTEASAARHGAIAGVPAE